MATVLVIEDSPVMRNLAAQFLIDAGHTVLEAEDGQIGLQLFERHRPALVITDILMPEREGLGSIRELRRLAPTVPIIAISASAVYLDVAKQFGADVILHKPLHLPDLVAAVNRLLTA